MPIGLDESCPSTVEPPLGISPTSSESYNTETISYLIIDKEKPQCACCTRAFDINE